MPLSALHSVNSALYELLICACFCETSGQGNTTGCPREPWHDLHCKIDGPAAYDVLTNFQERWLRAAKPHGIKKLKMSNDSLLIIERLPEIVGISDVPCLSEDDPESWHVQVLHTTSQFPPGSAFFF